MSDTVTRDEFGRLEARVSVLEGEFDGEKSVTRHILEQTRRNGDDIAVLNGRLRRVEADIGGLKSDVSTLKSDVATLKSDVTTLKSDVSTLKSEMQQVRGELRGLRNDLPTIVAQTLRDVLDERGR
ncbi:MAG: hypothetical protein GC150_04170 [Rhizobiales bacterium]|nr:hypothetical protein [Hyphomicrobiales bacterium]